ncbi:MAG: hypothetical protein WCA46_13620 [Actinocatenispora sp.]
MSQPGYGPGGPYPPDNPQGWGGAGQPNGQPPSSPYGNPYGQQPQPGYEPQPPMGQPPAGPGFGEQPPAAPASGPGYGEVPGGHPAQPTSGYAAQPTSGYAAQPTSGPSGYGDQPASGPGGPVGPQHTMPVPSGPPNFGNDQQHTMALPQVSGPADPGYGNRFASAPGERKRGPWIPVLAAAAAVFLILSVTMTVLFVSKNGAYNDEKKVSAQRQSTVTAQKKKIGDLTKELDSTKDKLDKANQDLSGAQNKNKDLAGEKATVAKCLSMLEDALAAAGGNDDKKFRKLWHDLQEPCQKADSIIG